MSNRPRKFPSTRRKGFAIQGRYGYRKSKPACLNGSERRKGPKSRPVAITLAERA